MPHLLPSLLKLLPIPLQFSPQRGNHALQLRIQLLNLRNFRLRSFARRFFSLHTLVSSLNICKHFLQLPFQQLVVLRLLLDLCIG